MATAESAKVLITLGVDTHQDHHVAVALDQFGRRALMFPTSSLAQASLAGFGAVLIQFSR